MGTSRRTRARNSREALIEAHLPLVRAVARRYAGQGVEFDDLVQAGSLGLVKASDRFDPGHGVRFAAFATPVIEGEIRHHLRDRATAVRLPRRLQQLGAEARRRRDELSATLGRGPTTSELAAALDADAGEVQLALDADGAGHPLPTDLGDAVSEPTVETEDRLLVESRLRVLAPRERQIVYLRFHADLTERQIAKELGISQTHVSRLLAAALEKLRTSETAETAEADETAETDETATAAETNGGPQAAPASEPANATTAESGDEASGPPAEAAPRHSGRFLVRMPSELHGALAAAAEHRHVSLNRFVTDALADAVARADDDADGPAADAVGAEPADDAPAGPSDGTGRRTPARAFRLVLAANVIVIAVAGALAVTLVVLALQRGI